MPRVPAKRELVGIAGQMLSGNMMPSADDGAFEQGEEGFGSVGRSPGSILVLALVFPTRVIHGLMGFPLLQRLLVARVLIGSPCVC